MDEPEKTISVSSENHESVSEDPSREDDSQSVTWSNLPKFYNGYEITYKVTEVNTPAGYEVKYASGGKETDGTVDFTTDQNSGSVTVTGTDQDCGEVIITNTLRTGALDVTKTMVIDGERVTSADTVNISRPFYVTVQHQSGKYVNDAVETTTGQGNTASDSENPTGASTVLHTVAASMSNTAAYFMVTPGQGIRFTGLPFGTYTVKEWKKGDNDTYTLISGREDASNSANFDIGDMKFISALSTTEGSTEVKALFDENSIQVASFNLVNAYTTGEFSVAVTKHWVDRDNANNSRPVEEGVKVYLTRKLENEDETKFKPVAIPGAAANNDGTVNNSITLTADNNWSAIVTNLPEMDANGVKYAYRWTEAPVTGYYQSRAEQTEETTNNGQGRMNLTVFTNTYVETELTVRGSKILAGAGNQQLTDPGKYGYSFTLQDDREGKEPLTAVSVNDGNFTFPTLHYSLADLEAFASGDSDIPTGYIGGDYKPTTIIYTLKEDGPTDQSTPNISNNVLYDNTVYTISVELNYNKNDGTLTATPSVKKGNDNYSASTGNGVLSGITFTNIALGSLKISKEINAGANANQEFVVTVALGNGMADKTLDVAYSQAASTETGTETTTNTSNQKTEASGNATFSLKGGESVQINHLPVGTNYTVNEAAVNGWHQTGEVYSNAGTEGTSGVITKAISYDTTDTVTLTNEQYGKLQLTKLVKVNGADLESSTATAYEKTLVNGTYSFVLAGPEPETTEREIRITFANGQADRFTVTKINAGSSTGAAGDGESGTGTADSGDSSSPTETNDNTETDPVTGILSNGVLTLSNLVPGIYTLKEVLSADGTSENGTTLSDAYRGANSGTGRSAVNGSAIRMEVTSGDSANDTAKATFINNINTGSLTIMKTVEGTSAIDKEFTINLTVTPPEGVSLSEDQNAYAAIGFRYQGSGSENSSETPTAISESVTFTRRQAGNTPAPASGESTDGTGTGGTAVGESSGYTTTIKLKKDERLTISGLPEGSHYAITEVDEVAGYSFDGTKSSGLTSTITADTAGNENTSAIVHNKYTVSPITINVPGIKVLHGRAIKENEQFVFDLTEVESLVQNEAIRQAGKAVVGKYKSGGSEEAGKASGSGNDITTTFTFEIPLTYTMEDLRNPDGSYETEKIFYYRMTERKGEDDTLLYAENQEMLRVVLQDNGSGTLTAVAQREKAVTGDTKEFVSISENNTLIPTFNNYFYTVFAIIVKHWEDDNNQAGRRPDAVGMNLYGNNEYVDGTKTMSLNLEPTSSTLSGDTETYKHHFINDSSLYVQGDWVGIRTELPKFVNGEQVNYTWLEHGNMVIDDHYAMTDMVSKNIYDSEQNIIGVVTRITNTYEPENITLTVMKTWNHRSNPVDNQPKSVNVTLYRKLKVNDTVVSNTEVPVEFKKRPGEKAASNDPLTLSGENNWTGLAYDVPRYGLYTDSDGKQIKGEYEYFWKETYPDNYDGEQYRTKVKELTPDIPYLTILENTYREVSVTPKAVKTIRGRDMAAGEFSFSLSKLTGENGAIDNTWNVMKTRNATVAQDVTTHENSYSEVIFDAIKYTKDDIGKTYWYRIQEINIPEGITVSTENSDKDYYDFSVSISARTEDKSLVATVQYNEMTINNDNWTSTPFVFRNTFQPGSLKIGKKMKIDEVELGSSSTLPTSAKTLADGSYTLLVTSENGEQWTLMYTYDNGQVRLDVNGASATFDSDGTYTHLSGLLGWYSH